MCGTCGCKSAESGKKNCGCGQDPCKTFGAEEKFVDCYYCGRNIDLYDETNDSISCDECGKIACGSYKCNYSKNPKETWEEFTCGECVAETFEARTTRKGGKMRPTTTVRDGTWIYTDKKDGISMDYDNQKVRKLGKALRRQGVPLKIKTKNAESTCASCGEGIDEFDIIGDGTNRGLCCVPDYYDDEPEMVHCSFCSKIIGTEKEVYDEETIDYEVANGETICVSCGEEREKELKNDLDPHYSPFYAESSPVIWDSKKGQLIDPPMFTVWIGDDTEHFNTFEEALEFAKNDIEEDEEAQITISYYQTLKNAESESPTIKFEVGKFYYTGTDYYKDAIIKIVKRTPTRVYFTFIDLLADPIKEIPTQNYLKIFTRKLGDETVEVIGKHSYKDDFSRASWEFDWNDIYEDLTDEELKQLTDEFGAETFESPDGYCPRCHVPGNRSTGRMELRCSDCGGGMFAENFEAQNYDDWIIYTSKYDGHTKGPWTLRLTDEGDEYGDLDLYGADGIGITTMTTYENTKELESPSPDVQLIRDAPKILEAYKIQNDVLSTLDEKIRSGDSHADLMRTLEQELGLTETWDEMGAETEKPFWENITMSSKKKKDFSPLYHGLIAGALGVVALKIMDRVKK